MKRQIGILGAAILAACAKAPDLSGPMPLAMCTAPTPNPLPSASAPGLEAITILSGRVFGPNGAPVDGAVVRATSLDGSVPYTATTTTFNGNWVINNLPEGARVQVLAGKDGWITQRHVVVAYTRPHVRNELDLYAEEPLAPL
jgi:hypothetical protein